MAQYKLIARLDDGDKVYTQKFKSNLEAYEYICEEWLFVEDFQKTFLEEISRAHSVDALLEELGFEAVKDYNTIDPDKCMEFFS